MPWGAVQLKPGVDTQRTMSDNQAGVVASQLIRYKEGLIQSYGGFEAWGVPAVTVPSTALEVHAWQDVNGVQRLAVGCVSNLAVITQGATADFVVLSDITPQKATTNPTPNFSLTAGSALVTVVDANANSSVFNTVYFNTPVAIGPYLLNGAYPITTFLSTGSYTISLPAVSTATVASSGVVPTFTISSANNTILVTLPNNGVQAIVGLFQQFIAPTLVGTSSQGTTVSGKYQVTTIVNSTQFNINALSQNSTTVSSAPMNGGLAQLVYYVTLGPTVVGSGFGAGGFGTGGWGTGIAQTGTPGTPITATDWTLDNWGEVLLACPENGPIYSWAADTGFQNAQVINQAPFFNGGIFVGMPQQILIAYRSTQSTGVQDPLIVRWSNQGDYTNWTVSNQTAAGSFHIPSGSQIVGGIQCPQFALISTDIEVWTMTYVGGTVIYNFTKVGNGCGFISKHACGILSGNPFWMARNNFFTLGSNGVSPLPCPVWDQAFQNINPALFANVRVGVNSAFNEIAWFYTSQNAVSNDIYVKVHIEGQEYEWDYGSLSRTAWTDISVLGMPLSVDNLGQVYQSEDGNQIVGAGLPNFQTGYWVVAEGEEIPFVDIIIPDFTYVPRETGVPSASLSITFFGVDYPGGPQTTYGPYTVNSATQFINCRIRNRLLSAFVQSTADTEFWRIGRIRFRYGASGRR